MRRLLGSLVAAVTVTAALAVAAGPATADDATLPAGPATTDVVIDLVDLGVDGDTAMIGDLLDRLLGDSVQTSTALEGLGLVGATVTDEGRRALRRLAIVRAVEDLPDLEILLDTSVPTIEAADLHLAGLDGDGAVVAVIDTGVDSSIAGLAGSVVAEACFIYSPAPAPGNEVCPNGMDEQFGTGSAASCITDPVFCAHGSHVAAIISGDGTFTGVAPDAGIIAIRVTGFAGLSPRNSSLGVIAALDHVYSLRDTFDIAAVNLSLGALIDPCTSVIWSDVVMMLAEAGIAVVAASGNEGFTDTISFPACLPELVSAGSTNGAGDVSDFSNTSELLDLLAPGECIDSDALVDPTCGLTSGTSFSAPHVAGAFALVADTHPAFDVTRTRNLLRATGEMVTRVIGEPRDPRFPELRLERFVEFEPFDDADDNSYWNSPSDWAKYVGVTTGTAPGIFEAGRTLTRAEAVTFLWRFMGSPDGHPPSGFPDVVAGSFYEAAVDWALAVGVTTGTSPTTFAPDDPVTRGQLATLMWRTVGEPAGSLSAGFVDVVAGAFYEAAVDWMSANEITTGTSPTMFSPESDVDRGQMITFVFRLADAEGAWSGSVEPPDIVLF